MSSEPLPQPVRLFDSFGIAPRAVRFFLIEKGRDLEHHEVDLLLGENRDPEYLKLNPTGQTPALELDDGLILSEAPVICEYLEDAWPERPLIGATPEQRAITRMWWRRVEFNICQPMILGFYYGEGLALFRDRIRCIPEAADGMKARARDGLRWLEKLLADDWIAGSRFTVADIFLYAYLHDLNAKGQPIPDDCTRLTAWLERVGARPAADKSLSRWG